MNKKIDQKELDDRYQNQNLLVKIWRRRWYLLIPYSTIDMWLRNVFHLRDEEGTFGSLRVYWSIAVGSAQGPMKWYYTMEETKEHFKQLKNEINKE